MPGPDCWVLGPRRGPRAPPDPFARSAEKISARFTPNRPKNKGFGMRATPIFSKSALCAARYAEVCDLMVGYLLQRGCTVGWGLGRAQRAYENCHHHGGCWVLGCPKRLGVGCWAAPRGWVLGVGLPQKAGCWVLERGPNTRVTGIRVHSKKTHCVTHVCNTDSQRQTYSRCVLCCVLVQCVTHCVVCSV